METFLGVVYGSHLTFGMPRSFNRFVLQNAASGPLQAIASADPS
jgi:hypothetical protein